MPAPGPRSRSLLITICCYQLPTQQGTPEQPALAYWPASRCHHPATKNQLGIKMWSIPLLLPSPQHHQTQVGFCSLCPFWKKVLPPSLTVEDRASGWSRH